MKKVLIVSVSILAALVLILAGLFFWKGGHHALVVADALEEWLEADAADQTLSVQFSRPGFYVDSHTEQLRSKVDGWTLTANTFWTEYGDAPIFGLTAGGVTAYLRRDILYMDTGRAYALPDLSPLSDQMGRLAAGLLLFGRVTKSSDTYTLTMDAEELRLELSVTMDQTIRTMSLSAELGDGTAVQANLTPKEPQSHTIPQPVADAMVLAQMERPMSLSEPIEMLLPALDDLLPLTGKLELGIASGVLELSESVDLAIDTENVSLSRGGILVDLSVDFGDLSPAALGLLALRNGTFSRQADEVTVFITLPGDATAALAEALVPQAADLDITFEDSSLRLSISGGSLTGASITANGSVPFLFAAIPLTFSATLTVT